MLGISALDVHLVFPVSLQSFKNREKSTNFLTQTFQPINQPPSGDSYLSLYLQGVEYGILFLSLFI